MNETKFHISNNVPLAWSLGLAKVGLGCFLIMALVHVATADRFRDDYWPALQILQTIYIGFPMLILCMVTWWRRKMTGWSCGLHLLAMLLNTALMYLISGVVTGGGGGANQGAINVGILFVFMQYISIAITLGAILLGFGVDWLLQLYRKNSNIA